MAVIALLLFTAAILYWLAPRLQSYAPSEEQGLQPSGSTLRLRFSRSMDIESVAGHLSIEPQVSGSLDEKEGELIFTPDQGWPSGETFTVTLRGGALAQGFIPLPVLQSQQWRFSTSPAQIAYLWPFDGPADLYLLNPQNGEQQRLTNVQGGILEYTASPDGLSFYYSTRAGGIARLDRLSGEESSLTICKEVTCRAPQVSPDGRFLAYERTQPAQNGPRLTPQVWVLPLDGGEPFAADPQAAYSELSGWSPNGWLTTYDPNQQAFTAHDLDSGERLRFPNQTGEAGTWTPDGNGFIVPEITYIPHGYLSPSGEFEPIPASHLLYFEGGGNAPEDLSVEQVLEDTSPVLSPDGSTLAFARKFLDPQRWTPGRQLWLMQLSSRSTHALTDAPFYNHASFDWSPDGVKLVYVRASQTNLSEPPEIWLVDVAHEESLRMVIGGYAPQWIP